MRQIYKQPYRGESASKTRERDEDNRAAAFEQLKRQMAMGMAGTIALREVAEFEEKATKEIDDVLETNTKELEALGLVAIGELEPEIPEPDDFEFDY